MPGLVYPDISTEKLIDLCSRSLYTLDGLWFTAVEQEFGLDAALKLDEEVWRRFGLAQARRVKNGFGIREESPIRAVIGMLQVDPVMVVYKPEIVALSANKAVFRCTNCPPQKARIRDGRGEFPCKPVGEAFFSSYGQAVDAGMKLSCLICPPDAHPPQYWCEWQFEL
ncbi:DUF6125 family protein [Chloroflexota bacterium]